MRNRKSRLNLRTLLLIIGLIGCLGPLFLLPSGIHAQSGSYDITYDLTVSDYNFTIQSPFGSYVPGSGFVGSYHSGLLYYALDVYIPNVFNYSTLTGFQVDYDFACADNKPSGGYRVIFNGTTLQAADSGVLYTGLSYGVGSGTKIVLDNTSCGARLYRVRLIGTSLSATFTPSPSPTPTLTPSPTPIAPPTGGGTLGKVCALLGLANATFTDLRRGSIWQLDSTLTTLPQNPPGTTVGLSIIQGSATLPLTLDPSVRYQIYVAYHVQVTTYLPDHFYVQLGSSPKVTIDIGSTLATQEFTVPDSIYSPSDSSPNIFNFVVSKDQNLVSDNGLIVDFACVSAINANPDGSGVVPVALMATCSDCVYKPVGNLIVDIPLLLGWLWCGISQLWDCVAKNLFAGIWRTLAGLFVFLSFVRIWLGLIISHGADWLNGNISVLASWLRGNVANVITSIVNGAAYVLKTLGVFDFLNGLINFILSIPIGIINAINSLGILLSSIGQTIGVAIAIVGYWIGRAFDLTIGVIGFIPQVIASIVGGFNTTATVPAWAPLCTDSNTLLYYPCLGMYVLDNTIFDGPIYLLIPAAMGIVGTYTLLWTVQQVKRVMEQS